MTVQIRRESPSDATQIHNLTRAAFPSPLEANIVKALRAANSLTLSLVAVVLDDTITAPPESSSSLIGHVAFSPVTIAPACGTGAGQWVGLGPVSVLPSRQGQGVGGSLIRTGLAMLRAEGVQGCVALGNPDMYAKFGFESGKGLVLDNVPPQFFVSVVLDAQNCPVGKVTYHEAFTETLVDVETLGKDAE
jgi:putative acetyltransferase